MKELHLLFLVILLAGVSAQNVTNAAMKIIFKYADPSAVDKVCGEDGDALAHFRYKQRKITAAQIKRVKSWIETNLIKKGAKVPKGAIEGNKAATLKRVTGFLNHRASLHKLIDKLYASIKTMVPPATITANANRPNEFSTLRDPDYNSPATEEPIHRGFYFLYGVPFFILIAYLTLVITYRIRIEEFLAKLAETRPEIPKCGRIDEDNFEFCGPLKLQSRFKGKVEHALMNEPSLPIDELVFDENLNEVVDIGSNVEEIEGISDVTMSAQKVNRNSTIFASKKSVKNPRIASLRAKALLKMGKPPMDESKKGSERKQ